MNLNTLAGMQGLEISLQFSTNLEPNWRRCAGKKLINVIYSDFQNRTSALFKN